MDMLPLCVVCSAPSYQSSRSIIGRPILVGDIHPLFMSHFAAGRTKMLWNENAFNLVHGDAEWIDRQ